MEIITRAQAIERGLTYYNPGTACKNGHVSKRNTLTGNCYACSLAATSARRKRDRERIGKKTT